MGTDPLHFADLLVVLSHVMATQVDLQLAGLKRVHTMGSSENMTISDQGTTAVELSLPLEANDPGELRGRGFFSTNNSVTSSSNATNFK